MESADDKKNISPEMKIREMGTWSSTPVCRRGFAGAAAAAAPDLGEAAEIFAAWVVSGLAAGAFAAAGARVSISAAVAAPLGAAEAHPGSVAG
jgi:hypothetical protein